MRQRRFVRAAVHGAQRALNSDAAMTHAMRPLISCSSSMLAPRCFARIGRKQRGRLRVRRECWRRRCRRSNDTRPAIERQERSEIAVPGSCPGVSCLPTVRSDRGHSHWRPDAHRRQIRVFDSMQAPTRRWLMPRCTHRGSRAHCIAYTIGSRLALTNSVRCRRHTSLTFMSSVPDISVTLLPLTTLSRCRRFLPPPTLRRQVATAPFRPSAARPTSSCSSHLQSAVPVHTY